MKNINKKSFISKIKTWHLLVGGAVLFIVNLILTLCEIYKWDVFSSNTLAIISLISILIVVVQMNMQNSLRNKELVAEQTQRKEDIERLSMQRGEDIKRLNEQRKEDYYYSNRPYLNIEILFDNSEFINISNIGSGIAVNICGYTKINGKFCQIQLYKADKIVHGDFYFLKEKNKITLAVNETIYITSISLNDEKKLIHPLTEEEKFITTDGGLKEKKSYPWTLYLLYTGITKYKIEIFKINFLKNSTEISRYSLSDNDPRRSLTPFKELLPIYKENID